MYIQIQSNVRNYFQNSINNNFRETNINSRAMKKILEIPLKSYDYDTWKCYANIDSAFSQLIFVFPVQSEEIFDLAPSKHDTSKSWNKT